ncbi:uncharacterized protein LOC144575272 [Carex rostrata]
MERFYKKESKVPVASSSQGSRQVGSSLGPNRSNEVEGSQQIGSSLGPNRSNEVEGSQQIGSSFDPNRSNEVEGSQPPYDPAKRKPISHYPPNEQDSVRRYYLGKGPCQPKNHNFPKRDISGCLRRFNNSWFNQYKNWLEYSIDKDAAFCLCCYLFRSENLGSGGGTNFVGDGYRNWKCKKGFDDHIGDVNSGHNQAQRKCVDLMSERRSIKTCIEKASVSDQMDYRVQLNASVVVSRFLAKQGLAFRGHDESESSNSKGNFLHLLRYTGERNPQIAKVILENAPKNRKLTSPDTQKEIVNSAAEETILEILADLDNELFSVLIDESRDVSVKEQMAVVIRFVNKSGSVVERFLGIVHVPDTAALSLKVALEGLFVKNGLTFSRLRGQGYDGASNMSGEFNGLQKLIMKENESAYYVHCWAHQLQLTLVHVAKNHHKIGLFFQMVSCVVNVYLKKLKRMRF